MHQTHHQETRTLRSRILAGSVVLLSGSGLATAISFAYNIAVARFLGPRAYGNASAVYTLLILISAVTLAFQIVASKVVAQQKTAEGKFAVYRAFHWASWGCGLFVALLLLLFRNLIVSYLNLPGANLVALLAVGTAFYVPLGSRRGYIQGAYGFKRLAGNLVLEGAVRLIGSVALIFAGYGVAGVIAANAAAVAMAWFAAVPHRAAAVRIPISFSGAFRELSQAMVFFAGQALINNCDIVLVKHFFLPKAAGLYAAVAMVGRVIFSFSSAVVNSMFPIVAGTRDEERRDLTVITTSLLLVLGIGLGLALALRIAPQAIWTTFFGSDFGIAGHYNLSYLLSLYAITTVIYSLSVVMITYEMSYKIANTSWVQLAFSTVVIAGICRFHSSLQQVIWVQFALMIVLFFVVAIPFLFSSLTRSVRIHPTGEGSPVRILRRVSEDEVIAEFLRADFTNAAFSDYHQTLSGLVNLPDLDDPVENARRRALLFLRHRALWKELPADTEWFEIELRLADIPRVRVFPRAQWRRLAPGTFGIMEAAEHMRRGGSGVDEQFAAKIADLGEFLRASSHPAGTVLLIGLSETDPLTLLDGNHRLLAAMLASPQQIGKLRFLCGLSPAMMECCWYNTNFVTLCRYGRNVLRHIVRSPQAELARVLETTGQTIT